jgi:hypothetical protein
MIYRNGSIVTDYDLRRKKNHVVAEIVVHGTSSFPHSHFNYTRVK